jgi:hypothetical protein
MAYAHVQTVSNVAPSSELVTITSSTAGSLLVMTVFNSGGAGRVASVTAGFVQIGTELVPGYASSMYYYENNPGGITSAGVTAWNAGTPGEYGVFISEYTGIATSSALITFARQSQASPGTGTDAVTSGTSNVTSQPALIFGWSGNPGAYSTLNAGTDFTSRDVDAGIRTEDKRVTATGNQAATFTGATDPNAAQTWMAAFAETSAAYTGLAWVQA